MGKKRERERILNPKQFLADDGGTVVSKGRSKAAKHHQESGKMISEKISSKILDLASGQRKEIEEESEAKDFNQSDQSAFAAMVHEQNLRPPETEDDIDKFDGQLSEDERRDWERVDRKQEEIDEEDEQLLEKFMSKVAGPQPTLGDVIAAKIREKEAAVSSEPRPTPKFDSRILEMYKGVGKALSAYTSGKIPKAFKRIPALEEWEEILYLTEPEKWSPNAVLQATRIFSSNMNVRKAERFYKLVLLPRFREDIRKNKRLHFALFQSLKKSMYKRAAFNKGILFPLCASGNCTLREAVILGSVIEKNKIPAMHSSIALLKLAGMEYCGTTSYFIKVFLDKRHSIPYRAVDALVDHFMRFRQETRVMPVIWHQSLLSFIVRYKDELEKDQKENLRSLMEVQYHYLVTPEILRELNNSVNRGEKGADNISSPVSVIKPVEEDKFDLPEVPMEED